MVLGQDMRSSSVAFSLGLHFTILIIMIVGLPIMARDDLILPSPQTIEAVDISAVTETTRVAPPIPRQEMPDIPSPPSEPAPQKPQKSDRPPPASKNLSAVPVTPPKIVEKPQPKKPDKPAVSEKMPVPSLPDMKRKPSKPEPVEEPQETQEQQFSSVLRNLVGEETPSWTDAPPEKTDLGLNEPQAPGMMVPLGQRMTISEQDALRRQLEGCWNVPIGAREAEDMVVDVRLTVNSDRTVREAVILDQSRYNSDPFFRAAADSAIRAVWSPQCTPLALPPEKYDQWRVITVRFNPREMF